MKNLTYNGTKYNSATLIDGDKFFVDKLECSLNDCIRN